MCFGQSRSSVKMRRIASFNRSECDHHPGHAGYAALGMIDVIAMSSGFLIGEAVLQDFLILGNERGTRMLSLSLSAHDPERSSRLQRNIGIGSVAAFFGLSRRDKGSAEPRQ